MDMKSSWFSWSKTVLQILLQHWTITISEGITVSQYYDQVLCELSVTMMPIRIIFQKHF